VLISSLGNVSPLGSLSICSTENRMSLAIWGATFTAEDFNDYSLPLVAPIIVSLVRENFLMHNCPESLTLSYFSRINYSTPKGKSLRPLNVSCRTVSNINQECPSSL
jgi:hypothetical protein